MINTLSILYYIRSEKSDRNGHSPIYCRITHNGQRTTFAVQRKVLPDKWDGKKGKVKGSAEEANSINSYLRSLSTKIYNAQLFLQNSDKTISAIAIKEQLLSKQEQKSKSLFKLFEDHNSKVKALINSDFAHGTHERYQTCLKHIRDFVKSKYNRTDFALHEVDYEFITELDYYFRVTRKCNNNTTVKYIKNFGKIIRIALAHGWIKSNPFLNYKVKLSKVDRGYLTMVELEVLANKVFGIPRIQHVCDIFLFQCYTGLAYIDTKRLTKQNLFLDASDTFWIKTSRVKTGTETNVPLLPNAVRLLEKYKTHSDQNPDGYILPVLSNQKMNAYLKEISALCGIDKRFSCHLARHTFATTITLNNGVSMEAVSKMLGHTNLATTKIYARMLDSRVHDEMQALNVKLTGNKL
jgi:integrase